MASFKDLITVHIVSGLFLLHQNTLDWIELKIPPLCLNTLDHDDISGLGQLYAESFISALTQAQNAVVELWRTCQTNFTREQSLRSRHQKG